MSLLALNQLTFCNPVNNMTRGQLPVSQMIQPPPALVFRMTCQVLQWPRSVEWIALRKVVPCLISDCSAEASMPLRVVLAANPPSSAHRCTSAHLMLTFDEYVSDWFDRQRLAAVACLVADGLPRLSPPPVVDLDGLIPCQLQLLWVEISAAVVSQQ